MSKSQRKDLIIKVLAENGFTSVEELSKVLFASESSIRRDLTELERLGLVKRSWGGAEVISAASNVVSFVGRSYNAVEEKQLIAKKAAALVKSGDIIFLDQSSTAYFLARELLKLGNLTVVSNNLEILTLMSKSEHTVISTGGTVSKKNRNCLIGVAAIKTFEGIYADFAFFSAHSLDKDGIISDCTEEEVFLRNAMLSCAKTKVFLCDSTKIDTRSAFKQCSLTDVDILVCDTDISEKFKSFSNSLSII